MEQLGSKVAVNGNGSGGALGQKLKFGSGNGAATFRKDGIEKPAAPQVRTPVPAPAPAPQPISMGNSEQQEVQNAFTAIVRVQSPDGTAWEASYEMSFPQGSKLVGFGFFEGAE